MRKLMKHRLPVPERGDILVLALIVIALMGLMEIPLFDILIGELNVATTQTASEEALQIAEAGVDYYQWHLAHFPTDYEDGTGQPGPYTHTYIDYETEQQIGTFQLTITPPTNGSTIVTIQSKGWTTTDPSVTRTVTAQYGVPSLAVNAFLTNSFIWIGPDESVGGQMQSNSLVRFDGTGNAAIMSAVATGTCSSSMGSPCPATENGVFGSAPSSVQSFWEYPVPAVDFSTLTSNLATLKSEAQTGGIYLSPSNVKGYSLVFNSNGTVSVYKVTALESNETGWDVNGVAQNEYTDYQTRTLQFTEAIPSNGIIYVEDNVWVEGTVNGRVLVAAAELPYNASTAPSIYIPNNIVYSAKNGTSVLGLIAQNNVVVTYHAPTNLEIDAAMIAQTGSVQFFYYPNDIKNSIYVFGSIITYGQWTWTWVDGNNNDVSGYATTNDSYDGNLLYKPPPGFPLSSSGYQQLTWSSN